MKYLDELEKLNLPKNMFAVFGSGPLAIRNLRENEDIDIIVKADLWNKLSEKHSLENEKCIKIGHLEIFKYWIPWSEDVNKLIDSADVIRGFRFVKLKYVLKWKKDMNREKDKTDIKLIEQYLSSNKPL